MAEHYSKEHRLNTKVKSSMAYPKFLCCLIVGVVAILIGYVLPQFESLFSLMVSCRCRPGSCTRSRSLRGNTGM